MSGLLGMHAGYHALKDCDTLLMLGTDFPYRQFYPQHARIAQVDARAEAIGRRVSVEQGLVGDVKATLEALLPRITARKDDRHLKQALERHAQDRQALVRAAQPGDAEGALHPQHLTSMIDELAADDAIFTCDVGTPTVWAARFLKMNGKRRLIGSFNHGSMASALAQAIGAQCAFPDRQVIALCGDGGLSMSLGDLLTLRQHALPIKIVVYDNDAYAFVDLEMKVAGLIPTQTRLDNPSFAALARAVGLVGQSVDVTRELDAELPRFLGEKGPALLDVRVRRNEVAWPPEIEASQATGFGLYAAKAVLSGQGDELLDLAKTSLFR